jgi:enediyne biosynthesis protein E4
MVPSKKPTPNSPAEPVAPLMRAGLVLTLLLAFGCGSKEAGTTTQKTINPDIGKNAVVFRDVTNKLQVKQFYDNGESETERAILETIGGGVAVSDFDRDGFDDLYFASGGELKNKTVTGLGGQLWRNKEGKEFTDITQHARVNPAQLYTHGTVTGDLNNDGFPDLLVTAYQGLALFINQGDGSFLEQTVAAGLTDTTWGTSAGFGDFDGDGNLDMYIAHYVDWSFDNHPPCKSSGVPDVCAPGIFTGLTDIIYMNDGQSGFVPKQSEIGLVAEGKGLGVLVADFNQDERVDIYVANDTTNNFLYRNQGGDFDEIGMASGTAVNSMGTPEGSMGLCTFDYDGDLLNDIWVCNYENQAFALYKNDGDFSFRYVTSTAGLAALGTTYVAWGTAAIDFDLDGDEDIVVANGHVMRGNDPAQLPLYLENKGNKRFENPSFSEGYFAKNWRGRGVGAFDLERDGDIDLAFTHVVQDAVVLANETPEEGNWWVLELVGTQSNRDAIGARVIIESNKRKLVRNVVGGGSYLSQNPYYLHWGLPKEEKIVSIKITWPSGAKQTLIDIAPKTRTMVVEPANH